MDYIIEGHGYVHEVQTMIQVFYPHETYVAVTAPQAGVTVFSRVDEDGDCLAAVFVGGEKMLEKRRKAHNKSEQVIKRAVRLSIYDCLFEWTGIRPSWGALTGIRPSKMAYDFMKSGQTPEEARRTLTEQFLVLPEKAALAVEIAQAEAAVLDTADGSSVALYVGVPFCPTRCAYCSFTAHAIKAYEARGLVDAYLDALMKELAFVRRYTDSNPPESVYIGGGTPTALNETQLERLLAAITALVGPGGVKEFSVEAGRPDTITKEKLRLLKKYGVGRISVNPQTMNEQTLRRIGRNHTPAQFLAAYHLARSEGFDHINIDLILGLPGESPDDVAQTMDHIGKLAPVSVTVHTLAIKRASELRRMLTEAGLSGIAGADGMERMLRIAASACRSMGLRPYYMYRQKNSSGNFENVGYAKKGYACRYNIQIMGERQTVIACGAGAATKTVHLAENRIERIFNVQNAEDYITRIDEMLERKQKGVLL